MQPTSSTTFQYKSVKIYFLEMHEQPAQNIPAKPGTQFQKLGWTSAAIYRTLYYGVGAAFNWLDRMVIPDSELEEKINADNTEIWVLRIDGQEAGFAEFVREKEYTEIQYFGLLPDFVGKGWGKFFLNWVIQKAWSFNPGWIQLNTCELDHPNALSVYQKSGFVVVREEIQERKILSR